MDAKEVLNIALTAGELLISNGSESYRVEETLERICKAYNFKSQCITTGKGILVSISDNNMEKVTSLAKSKKNSVDLYVIELINDFSRQVEKERPSYKDAMKRLEEIRNIPHFTLPVRIFAGGFTCFIYSLFFNGGLLEAVIATIIGMLIYYMVDKVSNVGFFQFFIFFFSGLLIGGISSLLGLIFPTLSYETIIIGAIMVLLPGVSFTNGIKDIVYGDFISGMGTFGEAALIVAAIGSGVGAALVLVAGI